MREIKFRVWCEARKEMLPIQRHSFKTNKSMPYGWNMQYEFDAIMQYTGLKDKNGKEIYEGDLVEHEMETDGEWDKYEACEVVFDETYGMYCFKNDAPNLLTDYRNLEVIGNVYENPELVK